MFSILLVGILIILVGVALSEQSKTSESSDKIVSNNSSKRTINMQEYPLGKKYRGVAINSEGRIVKVNYYETFSKDSNNYKNKAIVCEIFSLKAGSENVIEKRKIVEIDNSDYGKYIVEFLSMEKIHLDLFEGIVIACNHSPALVPISLARDLGSIYTNSVGEISKSEILTKLKKDVYSKFGLSFFKTLTNTSVHKFSAVANYSTYIGTPIPDFSITKCPLIKKEKNLYIYDLKINDISTFLKYMSILSNAGTHLKGGNLGHITMDYWQISDYTMIKASANGKQAIGYYYSADDSSETHLLENIKKHLQ